MDEPSILPDDDKPAQQAGDADRADAVGQDQTPPQEVNPFAPSATPPAVPELPRVKLPIHYWAMVVVALVLFVLLAFSIPTLGVPAVIALVAATIRVPWLQQRRLIARPETVLLAPVWLLVTSWAIVLAIGIAAFIAFVIICIPSGIVAFSLAGEDFAIPIVFGFSGLVGLGAFVWLFYLSLRLPA